MLAANPDQKLSEFQDIYKATYNDILQVAYRFFRDIDTAEDVVQETYIRLYAKLPKVFENEKKRRNWVMRIAHNACLELYRKRRTDASRDEEYGREKLLRSVQSPGVETLTQTALEVIINAQIDSLEGNDRIVYIMYAFSAATLQDISKITDASVGHIRNIIQRVNQAILSQSMQKGIMGK